MHDVPKVRPPSVTRILRAQGFYSPGPMPDQFYLDRGRAGHMAFELDDKGVLDVASLDERLLPFLTAHRAARKDLQMQELAPPMIETYLMSWPLGFAGRIDTVKWIHGWRSVIDWKLGNGNEDPATMIQIAAYRVLVAEHLGVPIENLRGASIYYRSDGTYQYNAYSNEQLTEGWHRFAAALDTYQWRSARKRLPED